ncbi:MAG TPA: hypothetical protein DD414_11160, partial [Lachnospiraceae bacterium]|nr:hypothetical protein [Lachnospiraceae bacterium]
MKTGVKKVLLAIVFVAIAMVSGGMVSIYEMHQYSLEARGAAQAEKEDAAQPETADTAQAEMTDTAQAETAVTAQPENEKTTQPAERAVQAEQMTFSC